MKFGTCRDSVFRLDKSMKGYAFVHVPVTSQLNEDVRSGNMGWCDKKSPQIGPDLACAAARACGCAVWCLSLAVGVIIFSMSTMAFCQVDVSTAALMQGCRWITEREQVSLEGGGKV